MTLWLDGQTGGTGLNKAECFDAVTVTCLAAAAGSADYRQPPGQPDQQRRHGRHVQRFG